MHVIRMHLFVLRGGLAVGHWTQLRSTQPCIPGVAKSSTSSDASKGGICQLCRVAGNTV